MHHNTAPPLVETQLQLPVALSMVAQNGAAGSVALND
jgi:hypothetical protein